MVEKFFSEGITVIVHLLGKNICIIFGFLVIGNKHQTRRQLARILGTIQKTFRFLIFGNSHRREEIPLTGSSYKFQSITFHNRCYLLQE